MKTVSAVFHPLLMATYACLLLWAVFPGFYSPLTSKAIPYVILAIFTTTFVIPVMSVLLMHQTKRITNLELTNREERILPFISIALFYGLTTYLFYTRIPVSSGLLSLMIAISVLICSISVVSLFFKISVHATAVWGFCGILTMASMRYLGNSGILILVAAFPLAGLTATSRLYLGRHTPKEIWTGSIVGFLFCLVSAYFLI